MELITPEETPKEKPKNTNHPKDDKPKSFSPKTVLGDKPIKEQPIKKAEVNNVNGGSGGGNKTINFKVEMKNYFNVDRTIGSKEVVANNIVAKINDRLRDAVVSL